MSKLTAIALALFIATTATATSPQTPAPPPPPTPQIDPYTGGLKPQTGPPICPPSNPNCNF